MERFSREQLEKSFDGPITSKEKRKWLNVGHELNNPRGVVRYIASYLTVQEKYKKVKVHNERIRDLLADVEQGVSPRMRERHLDDIHEYSNRINCIEKKIDEDIINEHRNGVVELYIPQNIDLFIGDNYTTALLGTKEYMEYVLSNVAGHYDENQFKLLGFDINVAGHCVKNPFSQVWYYMNEGDKQSTVTLHTMVDSSDDYMSVEHYIGSLKDAMLGRLHLSNIVWYASKEDPTDVVIELTCKTNGIESVIK